MTPLPSEYRSEYGSDRNRTVWFGRPPCTITTHQHIRRSASGYSSGWRPSHVVSRWALQLSLLTPYVQELGIPHAFASLVWLCGPLSGLFVQALVGHVSDRSTSKFGRRRPYVVAGAVSILISVILVGFSADIGGLLGDPHTGSWPRAIAVFVVGFWILGYRKQRHPRTMPGPSRRPNREGQQEDSYCKCLFFSVYGAGKYTWLCH